MKGYWRLDNAAFLEEASTFPSPTNHAIFYNCQDPIPAKLRWHLVRN
jgi:hypothetical protein